VPSAAELDEILGVVPEDHVAAYSFAKQVYGTAPLRTAVDHRAEEQRGAEEISRRFLALPEERRDAFAELPMNVMASDLVLSLAELHLSRKHVDVALMLSNCSLSRRPWMPEAYLVNARVRDRAGDIDGARNSLKAALQLRPGWPAAVEYLGALGTP
jgi:hypothetical protein